MNSRPSAQDTLRGLLVTCGALALIVGAAAYGTHAGMDPTGCLVGAGSLVTVILVAHVIRTGKPGQRDLSTLNAVSSIEEHPKSLARKSRIVEKGQGAA